MKKVKSIDKAYLPVKIYQDDLEKIISLFDENDIKYGLETEDYKFDNIQDLIDSMKGKTIYLLEIKAFDPYITIGFRKTSANIYISTDAPFVMGLFYKIDEIIKQSERPFTYNYYFIWPLYTIFPFFCILFPPQLIPKEVFGSIIALFLVLFIRILYIRMVKHSIIQIIHKEHVSNFFKRKKDDLILVVVSALIGAILGVLGTILTSKLLS